MQEEVENRTVNLAISTSKLSARTLINAFRAYQSHRAKVKSQKAYQADARIVGEQSIDDLMKQNQGATNIAIEKTDVHDFKKYLNRYSKRFFEDHREAITLHKAAKDAFDKMGLEKLPKVKDLSAEYSTVLEEKKKLYAEYRTARAEMQEYQIAKRNVEMFYELQEQAEKQQNNRENTR